MKPSATLAVSCVVLLACFAVGCRTATGPGLHVTVRAEPKKGYTPPSASGGDAGGYGATVEPSQSQAAREPGYDLINYRSLAGIVLWIEPARPSSATAPSRPPVNATVDARHDGSRDLEDVQIASVGGRITLRGVVPGGPAVLVRTRAEEVSEVSVANPVFVPDRAGLVEVLRDGVEEPIGRVYVAPTPWVRKLRGGERVTFAPLPPGRYTATAWHPILPGSSRTVDVKPGPLTKLTLTVGVNPLPKAGTR